MKISSIPAIAALAAVTLTIPQFTVPAQSNQQSTVSQSAVNGLKTVTFETAAGKIRIYLPDDMRPGDTITGTVTAEPRGGTEAEREANQGVLNGMVVDVGGEKRVSVSDRILKWLVPTAARKREIRLFGQMGSPQPVAALNLVVSKLASAGPADFSLPQLSQTGRPLEIFGPFDGNAENTRCMIGGRPVEIVAESPRSLIVKAPSDRVGPADISVTDNGRSGTGQHRTVGIELSAPKTNIVRGERVEISSNVTGLQGIQSNVRFQLVTTGSANMTGGNVQTFEIRPMDLTSTGTYTRSFQLTGTQTGGFTVTATVLAGQPVAGNSCKCVCEPGKTPIVTAGRSKLDGGGMQHAFKANVAKAACNGNKCSIEKTEYSWSIGAGSTATYTVAGAKKDGETLKLDVTGAGTVVLTVTVTITCSDGTKCAATGTKTFTVDAK